MSPYRGAIRTLYVRNISERVRYDDLKKLFAKYGKILDITMPLDFYSRQPKGYCFVEYEDPRDADEALYRLDRQMLYGRELEVEFARGDRKTPSEMKSRESTRRYDHSYSSGSRYNDSRRSRSRSRSRSGGRRSSKHSRSRSKSEKKRKSSGKHRNVSYERSRSRTKSQSREHSPNDRSLSPQRNHSGSPSNANGRPRKPNGENRSRSDSH